MRHPRVRAGQRWRLRRAPHTEVELLEVTDRFLNAGVYLREVASERCRWTGSASLEARYDLVAEPPAERAA